MKILICSPLFYVFLLIVAAWLCRHSKRWKWTLAGLAVFASLFFSLEPIYEIAAKKWSEGYPWTVPAGKTYQYGIVLGGCSYWDWERNRPEFGGNVDRLTEGIQLYHKGIIRKLVIASDGSIIQREDPTKQSGNPTAMTDYLIRLGIPRQDIILETKATTTHENAVFIKQLLDEHAVRAIQDSSSKIQVPRFKICVSAVEHFEHKIHRLRTRYSTIRNSQNLAPFFCVFCFAGRHLRKCLSVLLWVLCSFLPHPLFAMHL